ncbi:F/Y rich C-terminus-domain-containing protein [Absidia repens]|uniref:F/Y rich C-terminus-domain-containing protein n=1 Tax=Absidia repens TaxID=90262 RepID=A0A1X2HK34_9FUNG|nr:F/Y rich C-terminus-domain-containing protein [Absidia repens]
MASVQPSTTPATPPAIPSAQPTFNEDKYKKLKRKLREIIGTNDAMLKQYEQTRKKIKSLTYERNLLLDNIARMEQMVSSDDNSSDLQSDASDSGGESDLKNFIKTTAKAQPKQRRRRIKKESSNQSPSGRDQATVVSAPPKRSKMSKVPAKTRRVQPIDRDESGNPKLPQQIGVLTVLKLGTIEPHREAFHNERYIFPIGYTVSRTYPSMVDPANNTVITSTIIDGGDGPRFSIEAADQPGEPIIANSATGAWTVVVRKSNEIRQRDHSNSASGPDYYGFKHPTIAKMIQDLPGATELQDYVWQPFEEMEPKAAKGVMAAAEKKRGNLEQMGSANRKGAAAKAKAAKAAAKAAAAATETTAEGKGSEAETKDENESGLLAATTTSGDGHSDILLDNDNDTSEMASLASDTQRTVNTFTPDNQEQDDEDGDEEVEGDELDMEDDDDDDLEAEAGDDEEIDELGASD